MIKNFMQELRTQRWDDHRYYHHSRINQSLHFVSAASFLFAYVMLFIDPVVSALVGWLVSMTTRQAGHFFFEPKGYDHVNHATHEHKEEIKVGYNLQRKVVLMAIWALSPLVLYLDPTLFGMFTPWTTTADFMRQVAKIWLAVGIGGLLFRTVHLFFIRDVETGLVWMTKILTDPFSDLKLYYKAPLALMKGELIDPGPREARQARVSVVAQSRNFVMPGLVPGIHVLSVATCDVSTGRRGWPGHAARRRASRFRPAMTRAGDAPSAPELLGKHLFQDLPLDVLVGEGGIVPPPAVALHLLGGRDEAVGDLAEIVVGVVQAEDQPAGSDPAQRQPFGAQIILQHPVVAGRLGILHHPDRREIADAHRQGPARPAARSASWRARSRSRRARCRRH